MERDPPDPNEAVDFGPASPWSRPPVRRPAARASEVRSRREPGVLAPRAPTDALIRSVRRPLGGLRQVTVANPTPGAGKTVATLMLGLTFGRIRGAPLLAWDNTEALGTLGSRASPGAGFDVFAFDEAATGGQPLAARAFRVTREGLAGRYGLILVDTGNDIHAPTWRAAVDATDQFVITVRAGDDSVDSGFRLLDRLDEAGRSELVRRAVVVITMPPPPADSRPGTVERFEPRCRAVLWVPYDRHVDSAAPVRYDGLSPESRLAWLGVAAAAADGL